MTRVTISPAIRAQLHGSERSAEVCDEMGRTLGFFHPVDETGFAGGKIASPYSDREIEGFRKEPGGRPLAEILKDLPAHEVHRCVPASICWPAPVKLVVVPMSSESTCLLFQDLNTTNIAVRCRRRKTRKKPDRSFAGVLRCICADNSAFSDLLPRCAFICCNLPCTC